MERARPQCQGGFYGTDHSQAAHVSHEFFPDPWGKAALCRGWSEREDDAAALMMRLDQVALDNAWPLKMPAGARLECHPLVVLALHQLAAPSFSEFTASLRTGEDLIKPQIPVVVTAGMERGRWRITADDGLIAEGTVRDD